MVGSGPAHTHHRVHNVVLRVPRAPPAQRWAATGRGPVLCIEPRVPAPGLPGA